jgi:hypothetical protein
MQNLLLNPLEIEYATEETPWGTWRRFLFPDGQMFAEFRSHNSLLGLPWIHMTWGRCPETMRRITAKGVFAVGKFAVGGVAIGHVSLGGIAVGQLGLGLLLGVGQATTGLFALGQLAIGGVVGIGQLTCGALAIGQLAYGQFVLAQFGLGEYVWDMRRADFEAVKFFKMLFLR